MTTETVNYRAAKKYFGDVAASYEDRRTKEGRWQIEQDIVAKYVRDLPTGAEIADVPFGTGRFAPFYIERKLKVFGADISPDMIAVAKEKIAESDGFRIEVSAAEALPLPDRSVDYLICHRYIKWLPDLPALERVMSEFARVTRREMFIQLKLRVKRKKGILSELINIIRRPRPKVDDGKARTHQFSASEFEKVVRSNGFQIKNIAPHSEISRGVAYYTITRV